MGDSPVCELEHGLDKSADRPKGSRTQGAVCYLSAIPQPASKIGGDSHNYGMAPSGNSSGHTTVPPTQNVHHSGNICSESVGDCRAVGDSVTMVQQTRRCANLPDGIPGTNPRGVDPCGIDTKKGNDGWQGVGTDVCACTSSSALC